MKNNEKNLQSFSMVMWGVAEEFGGKISDNGMMMRFRALLDYSLPQITAAGSWLLKNREKPFPPVPTTKEFIDAIRVLEGVVEVSLQSRAQAQIDIVLTKLKRQGRNATVDFE